MNRLFYVLFTGVILLYSSCGDEGQLQRPNLLLQSLSADAGVLTPEFSSSITNYTVIVSNAVSSMRLTAFKLDTSALLTYLPARTIPLAVGSNLMTVQLTSPDGEWTNRYNVVVVRTPNVDLTNLTVNSGILTPVFGPGITKFTVNVTNAVSEFTVIGSPVDPLATIEYSPVQPMFLYEGSNRIKITVTGSDGITTKEFIIQVHRNGATPVSCTSSTLGITLKGVPSGTFQRDATADNSSYVSSFRMSATEITRAQYSNVMGVDPTWGYSSGTGDPVQRVSWYHAVAFCNKLSIADGLMPVYRVNGVNFTNLLYSSIPIAFTNTWDQLTVVWSASGYRLPTEMEWMWAAMGAIDNRNKAFSGSTGNNAIGDYAWYQGNSAVKTHPVGTKLPNELGLYDMSGNAYEWCWDWHRDEYPAGWLRDYRGPAQSGFRVPRGGNFVSDSSSCSVSTRMGGCYPFYVDMNFGVRIVRQ